MKSKLDKGRGGKKGKQAKGSVDVYGLLAGVGVAGGGESELEIGLQGRFWRLGRGWSENVKKMSTRT